MDDLYVKPEYKANGIGTQLIHEVIKFAKGSLCHKLHRQVSNWNKVVIDFYRKIGVTMGKVDLNCDLKLD